jgi:DNA recombination protein RmuC
VWKPCAPVWIRFGCCARCGAAQQALVALADQDAARPAVVDTTSIDAFLAGLRTAWRDPESNECVDFAIRLPHGGQEGPLWLPIDAKFPSEAYERLIDAADRCDGEGVERALRELEASIRREGASICEKYVCPPHTTDFAILYLPTEGLYAEVIRRPGLMDDLQRRCRIVVAGPTVLLAILNSLQMGFRTLAIQKRSSEVRHLLSAVKTEFDRVRQIRRGAR